MMQGDFEQKRTILSFKNRFCLVQNYLLQKRGEFSRKVASKLPIFSVLTLILQSMALRQLIF
jgi:hypothetical protein